MTRKIPLAGAALAGSALATLAVLAPAQPAAAQATSTAPVVRELITVTASSHTTTYATFRAYLITGTRKVEVFGPWTARVGYHGIAAPGAKREGDGRTPSGTFGFPFFFGVDANPGVSFPYRRATTVDYWDDDSSSPRYNEWVDAATANPGRSPEPMHNVPAYNYGAVIDYNLARTPGLGSAIFLHVSTGGDTAGCVSLPQADLLKVLRWLKPADNPRITISG